jgi:hypothetical protein
MQESVNGWKATYSVAPVRSLTGACLLRLLIFGRASASGQSKALVTVGLRCAISHMLHFLKNCCDPV